MRGMELARLDEGNAGRRPAFWWRCEAPELREEYESEVNYLRRRGLLTAKERRILGDDDAA